MMANNKGPKIHCGAVTALFGVEFHDEVFSPTTRFHRESQNKLYSAMIAKENEFKLLNQQELKKVKIHGLVVKNSHVCQNNEYV